MGLKLKELIMDNFWTVAWKRSWKMCWKKLVKCQGRKIILGSCVTDRRSRDVSWQARWLRIIILTSSSAATSSTTLQDGGYNHQVECHVVEIYETLEDASYHHIRRNQRLPPCTRCRSTCWPAHQSCNSPKLSTTWKMVVLYKPEFTLRH